MALQAQFQLLKAQMAAQKSLQRDAAIKAELGHHKTPQIKVEFLYFFLGFLFFFFRY